MSEQKAPQLRCPWVRSRMNQLLENWQKLDFRRRIILIGAMVGTLVAVLSLAQIATRPGSALLFSGLDSKTAGAVISRLEQMNIPSEVRGDAIYVPENERDRLRLALAGEGLPRQGQPGLEILEDMSVFTSSNGMIETANWRALEGELARTILSSQGVEAARVHIAVPARRSYARNNAPPTASVTVTMASGGLTVDQATAFRYLVALAVPGLEPDQVVVADSAAGVVLAPGGDNAINTAATQAANRESRLKAEIEDLLTARVGRDRVRVSVSVEADREAETVTERIIRPDSRVTIHSDTEEISDNAEGAAGAVTVASNLPTGDAAGGADRKSARTETRERVNYDYSEVRRETVRGAGAIRRISVAVLVDGIISENADGESVWVERPEDELEDLRNLVIASIGYDEERGDIVTVDSMAFQPGATPGAFVEKSGFSRFLERNALTLIQLGVLSAVILALGLTVIRPILGRRDDEIDITTLPLADMAEGQGQGELVALPNAGADGLDPFDEDEPAANETLLALVAENPEKSALMLKSWLEEQPAEAEEAA